MTEQQQDRQEKLPVVFRNQETGARFVVDTSDGVKRIEETLGGMWRREP